MKKATILARQFRSLLIATISVGVISAAAQATSHADYLAQWLEQPTLTLGDATVDTASLREFYTARANEPIWVDSRGLTKQAQSALAVFEQAEAEGLNPAHYALNTIHTIAAMPRGDSDSAMRRRLSLELLMSHAALTYAADLHGGTTNPQWQTGKEKITAAEQTSLLTQLAESRDKAAILAALTPTNPHYKALKAELRNYHAIAANGGWPEFVSGNVIKPGMSDARLVNLRTILMATGDLKETKALQSQLYDETTQEAVKHFQERHGIEADGVIGAGTQAALATPVSERITQIASTMERMRWMPQDLGQRYVLVNIPGYRLTAVSGADKLSMNVIVGKPATKTPMFSKTITDVVLNPSWGVPARIAANEMLPKVRTNPEYLVNAGYTVTEHSSGGSRVVDPTEIDWESVDSGSFNYSFRQRPGDGNALGKVKFTIPQSDSIYLHDTAQRGLFTQANRSLSHGCIRLSDPKALTEFVLNHEGWSDEKVETAYNSPTSRTIAVNPLPVHLVYWTSWVNDDGRIHFSRDIYGMDKKLIAAMDLPAKGREATKLAMN